MKRSIVITLVLILISLFVGCATTSEERKEEYDLRRSAGEGAFVGNLDPSWRFVRD
jgi:hypothetical protein